MTQRRLDRRSLLVGGVCLTGGVALGWTAATSTTRPVLAAADESPGHEDRLKKLNLELPKVQAPKGGTLVPAVRVGDVLYVSNSKIASLQRFLSLLSSSILPVATVTTIVP